MANEKIIVQTVMDKYYDNNSIIWDILRADLIHPVCSGNKFFKLKYYLQDAIQKNHTTIKTSGGPWSNHIVATAFAAQALGLDSIGIIRGEKPKDPSNTLLLAEKMGMKLEFVSRTEFTSQHDTRPGEYLIPAGGFGELGAKGAAGMLDYVDLRNYTHIFCATGTGTMLAGLTLGAPTKKVIGIAVLKHPTIGQETARLIDRENLDVIHDFHMGGYAKKTPDLIPFMNDFYLNTGIPTDFVYTAKLMYAIRQLIQNQYFPSGSRILAIHSGGLQGNKSLKNGELVF